MLRPVRLAIQRTRNRGGESVQRPAHGRAVRPRSPLVANAGEATSRTRAAASPAARPRRSCAGRQTQPPGAAPCQTGAASARVAASVSSRSAPRSGRSSSGRGGELRPRGCTSTLPRSLLVDCHSALSADALQQRRRELVVRVVRDQLRDSTRCTPDLSFGRAGLSSPRPLSSCSHRDISIQSALARPAIPITRLTPSVRRKNVDRVSLPPLTTTPVQLTNDRTAIPPLQATTRKAFAIAAAFSVRFFCSSAASSSRIRASAASRASSCSTRSLARLTT
jgi:hypothetical protein